MPIPLETPFVVLVNSEQHAKIASHGKKLNSVCVLTNTYVCNKLFKVNCFSKEYRSSLNKSEKNEKAQEAKTINKHIHHK